jgi:ADP-L-glycero-D-manno-heptose 6-epimerase
MIIVTGAAGFIGSNIVADLLAETDEPICVCDWDLTSPNLSTYYASGQDDAVLPTELFQFLNTHRESVSAIIHMGATTSTVERDTTKLLVNNVQLTLNLWFWCAANNTRFIYASSASVYGFESTFWDTDEPKHMRELLPLNAYGKSKLATDIAISTLAQSDIPKPSQSVGLRFFNVYGPNEWHKGDQASLVTKMFGKDTVELFDVSAARDFVYVKDCSRYVLRILERKNVNGIFNIGTEQAMPFESIASIMKKPVRYIPIPDAISSQYQFYTRSVMSKAKVHDLWFPPTSLEDGINDYINGPKYR